VGLAREVSADTADRFAFSICTLVTDRREYAEMIRSFVAAGFDPGSCEYLYVDNNPGNRHDAYAGINRFLAAATGRYVILCHQDVLLRFDGRPQIERRLAELDARDPAWALAGNAGGTRRGAIAVHITDGLGEHLPQVALPARAVSLDENFIVIRRDAGLGASADLQGFHLYGTDLCLIADVLGRGAWIIDFHLFHKSRGSRDESFRRGREALIAKYRRAFADRFVRTTCTKFYVSGRAEERPVDPFPLQAARRARGALGHMARRTG
jgi:hypothetical protein